MFFIKKNINDLLYQVCFCRFKRKLFFFIIAEKKRKINKGGKGICMDNRLRCNPHLTSTRH